jgi:hypothetical protein
MKDHFLSCFKGRPSSFVTPESIVAVYSTDRERFDDCDKLNIAAFFT